MLNFYLSKFGSPFFEILLQNCWKESCSPWTAAAMNGSGTTVSHFEIVDATLKLS